MTVESNLARKPYTISGAGPYAIPFYFLADADIIAIQTPASGAAPITLALTTDYTLSGAGDTAGGALTLVKTGIDGDTLTIINEPDIVQLAQYPETGPFPSKSHENALDKLTMIAKRVYDLASRSLRLNDGDTATSLELPISSPGKLIGWDVNGELTNTSPAGVGPGTITTTELAASVVTDIANGAAAKVVTNTLGTAATGDIGTEVQAYDADTAKLDVKQTFTAQQTPKNGTLTDGATINWDGDSNGQIVSVTLGGNRAMAAPANIVENTLYLLRIAQDGTGSRTLSWDAAFKFGSAGAPTLTTTASKVDFISFVGGAGNTLECLGTRLNAV